MRWPVPVAMNALPFDTIPERVLDDPPVEWLRVRFRVEINIFILVTDKGLSIANRGWRRNWGKMRPDRRDVRERRVATKRGSIESNGARMEAAIPRLRP